MKTSEKVILWAKEKGLDDANLFQAQSMKILEELGETFSAILKGKREEEIDGFGDLLVTIEILALQRGVNLEEAYESAYQTIKDRKGKMVNGSFIKEESLI